MGKKTFPYPTGQVILWEKRSTNPYWIRRRNSVAKEILKARTLSAPDMPNIEDAIATMRQISTTERIKEEKLIQSSPAYADSDPSLFFQNFNEIVAGAQHFKEVSDRIKDAATRTKKDGTDFKGLAPNMASLFARYLEDAVEENIESLMEGMDPSSPIEQWDEQFQKVFDHIIDCTMEKMSSASGYEKIFGKETTTKSIYGGGKAWEEIHNIIYNDPLMKENFKQMLFTQIGKENIKSFGRAVQGSLSDIKGKFKENLKLNSNSQVASLGGYVSEFVGVALQEKLREGAKKNKGKKGAVTYDVASKVVSTNYMKTDSMTLCQIKQSIDAQQSALTLLQELDKRFAADQAEGNAQKVIENFFNDNMKQLAGSIVMFVNAKNYGIGKGTHTMINNKRNGKLSDLPTFLEETGALKGDPQEFLKVIYNVSKGTLFESIQPVIKQEVEYTLKIAAAKLMFDDYKEIGKEFSEQTGNAIHVYQFDEVFIPSSMIFSLLADAMEAAKESTVASTTANITFPDQIEVDYPETGPDPETKEEILRAWQESWDLTAKQGTWELNFKINVRNSLKKFLGIP